MLTIELTKISPTHHHFAYTRVDNTGEILELETKTFLFHDLLHFAVETEARLANSFYGTLAKNGVYADFKNENQNMDISGEAGMTEKIVGSLTGTLKNNLSPQEFLSSMKNWLDATGEQTPPWLTEDFVLRIQERMRKLLGQWNGTPFGKTMKLNFPYFS